MELAEAQGIIETLGAPPPQCNEMSGMMLIALCGLTPDVEWSAAERRSCTVTKGIMHHIRRPPYVSVFPDFREFWKHMKVMAWEKEIGLSDAPDHMIHYNDDRFLGPRRERE